MRRGISMGVGFLALVAALFITPIRPTIATLTPHGKTASFGQANSDGRFFVSKRGAVGFINPDGSNFRSYRHLSRGSLARLISDNRSVAYEDGLYDLASRRVTSFAPLVATNVTSNGEWVAGQTDVDGQVSAISVRSLLSGTTTEVIRSGFTIEGQSVTFFGSFGPVVSPDGRMVVFTAEGSGFESESLLIGVDVATKAPRLLARRPTFQGQNRFTFSLPTFSHDGALIAFAETGGTPVNCPAGTTTRIRVIRAADSSNVLNIDTGNCNAPTAASRFQWSPSNAKFLYTRTNGGLFRIEMVDVAAGSIQPQLAIPDDFVLQSWTNIPPGDGDALPTLADTSTTSSTLERPLARTEGPADLDELPAPSKAVTEAAARVAHESGRSPLAVALRAPKNISTEVGLILTNLALAVGIALLVFPSVLFNSTYEENYDRIHKRRKTRVKDHGPAKRWLTFIGVALATAALAALLDPKIKADRATALLVLGVGVATIVTSILGHFVKTRYLREVKGRIRAYPGGVVIGALTVAVSRLVNFLPGYLYGVVGGFESEPEADRQRAGRAAAIGEAFAIALALGSWFAWQPIADRAAKAGASEGIAVADALLASIAALSFQGLLFSMIPIKSLPGEKLWKWNKVAWAVFMTIGAFSFLHVLAHPAEKYTGSVTVMLGLFAAFGVASVGFWAYFRIKKVQPVAAFAPKQPAPTPADVPLREPAAYFAATAPPPVPEPLPEPESSPAPEPKPPMVNGRPKRDRPLRAPGRE